MQNSVNNIETRMGAVIGLKLEIIYELLNKFSTGEIINEVLE